ncbi:MAG: DUF4465 domain-containing protein [Muribaculaceae bacterium]|nr:DUF4465 domain-containing protein [Muribaculaceae bacterium]
MKLIKTLFAATALTALSATMVSCSDNDDTDNSLLLLFTSQNLKIDPTTKAWADCYVESAENDLNYAGFQFSHSANEAWKSWTGFCPTSSSDNIFHDVDQPEYQWGSIAGGGVFDGVPYMLAFWDSYNERDGIGDKPSVSIKLENSPYNYFYPQKIAVTNSAYGYYAMRYGTAFNRVFDDDDSFKLIIIGKLNGKVTGEVSFTLADGRRILAAWADCDLTPLGAVDELCFRMESTDSGEFGINNPTYFCLDNFRFTVSK